MLSDLNDDQKNLFDVMSKISERCYAASWLMNTEYILWDAVINGTRKFGQDMISKSDIDSLMQLSNKCNSWIYFDEEKEESAIDINLWREKYNACILKYPKFPER